MGRLFCWLFPRWLFRCICSNIWMQGEPWLPPVAIAAVSPHRQRGCSTLATFKRLCSHGWRHVRPVVPGCCALMTSIRRATAPVRSRRSKVICAGWAWSGMARCCSRANGVATTTPGCRGCAAPDVCSPVAAPGGNLSISRSTPASAGRLGTAGAGNNSGFPVGACGLPITIPTAVAMWCCGEPMASSRTSSPP